MAINLATKFEKKVAERFSIKSITDAWCGKDYSFEGVKSINVWSVNTVPMVDYTRSGLERFGDTTELGDTVQTMTMTKDRGFTFSIDKGNKGEQYNVKQSNKALQRQIDEVITPEIDIYRLKQWCTGAGLSHADGALDSGTVLEAIFAGSSAMNNKLVPMENRVVLLKETLYMHLLLANKVVGVDTLGAKTIATGRSGNIAGITVVPVPDSYMPTGVNFLIKYRNATVDPFKLKSYKIHVDPPGIDGDKVEGRVIYDAFVLDAKKNGLYVSKVS